MHVMDRVVKATALQPWGVSGKETCESCSDEVVETGAIERRNSCENVDNVGDKWNVTQSDISRVINCVNVEMLWNGQC